MKFSNIMDPKIFLEFMNISKKGFSFKVKSIVTKSMQRKSVPFKIKNNIKIPVYERPKSATISCLTTDISKIKLEKGRKTKRSNNSFDRTFKTAVSEHISRPSSGSSAQRKVEKDCQKLLLVNVPQAENSSELTSDHNIDFINNYAENYNLDQPKQEVMSCLSKTKKKKDRPFASDVPKFFHENFPVRKIRRAAVKKSKTYTSYIEIPQIPESRKKSPLQACKFHLKRRYYPVKCKLDFPFYKISGQTSPMHNEDFMIKNL